VIDPIWKEAERKLMFDLRSLRRNHDAAISLLRELEWYDNTSCPICMNPIERGHSPDCKLKELIG